MARPKGAPSWQKAGGAKGREFNTFGPVDPQYHYHVDRVAVKAALREKIDKGRYLTLNASRQTGKTTNPAVTEEGDQFELSMAGKTLRIY